MAFRLIFPQCIRHLFPSATKLPSENYRGKTDEKRNYLPRDDLSHAPATAATTSPCTASTFNFQADFYLPRSWCSFAEVAIVRPVFSSRRTHRWFAGLALASGCHKSRATSAQECSVSRRRRLAAGEKIAFCPGAR